MVVFLCNSLMNGLSSSLLTSCSSDVDVFICNNNSGDNPGKPDATCSCYDRAIAERDWSKKCHFEFSALGTKKSEIETVMKKTGFEVSSQGGDGRWRGGVLCVLD